MKLPDHRNKIRNSRVPCMQLALLGSFLRKEPMKWQSQEAISLWLILHQE